MGCRRGMGEHRPRLGPEPRPILLLEEPLGAHSEMRWGAAMLRPAHEGRG
jgi:hypothetical protein